MKAPVWENTLKKIVSFIILVLAAVISIPCDASFIEVDTGNNQFVGQIYLDQQINNKIGVFAYGQKSEEWSEFYIGPTRRIIMDCFFLM